MAAPREKSAAATSSAAAADAAGAGGGGDRWGAAVGNLTELGANVAALQRLLAKKAVFVDEDIFSKASLAADQARTIKVIFLCFALLVAGAPDSPPIPSPVSSAMLFCQ